MNTNSNTMRGAVIYVRVSTDEQAEHGTSLANQRDVCRSKALALNLPLVAELADPGVSGAFYQTRPGLQEALRLIEAGEADTLLCYDLSRLSRVVQHQQEIKRRVEAVGGRLAFCDTTYADNAAGALHYTIDGGFKEYERAVIKERTTAGREKKAQAGQQPSRALSPFGYHIVSHADILRGDFAAEQVGQYVPVDTQAAVVREVFERCASGLASLSGLCRWLTETQVPTPGGGRVWYASTLRFILNNPVYKGLAIYGRHDCEKDESRLLRRNKITGEPLRAVHTQRRADPATWITFPCPALVSEATWDAAQERLSTNKAQKGGNPARVRMLSSRAFCPQCGGALCLQALRAPRVPRYICSRYHEFTSDGGRQCVPTGYALPTVEESVVRAIEDARDRPEAIQSAMREALSAYRSVDVEEAAGSATAWRQEKRAVESALQSLAAEEVAAVQGQIAGIRAGASPDAYAAAFADIAARRKDLQDRRGQLARQIELSGRGKTGTGKTRAAGRESDAELLARAWNDVRRVLTSADVSGSVKRDAIGALIEKVVPLRRGEATGTTVYFLPGVFPYAPSEGHDTLVSICALSQNTTSK